jgi:hypothetical protein
METINDAAMLEASMLTAKQLKEATNIVEAQFGSSSEGNRPLVAAVLGTLARNYGMRLAAAGR